MCGVRFSTATQAVWCEVPHPSTWPPVIRVREIEFAVKLVWVVEWDLCRFFSVSAASACLLPCAYLRGAALCHMSHACCRLTLSPCPGTRRSKSKTKLHQPYVLLFPVRCLLTHQVPRGRFMAPPWGPYRATPLMHTSDEAATQPANINNTGDSIAGQMFQLPLVNPANVGQAVVQLPKLLSVLQQLVDDNFTVGRRLLAVTAFWLTVGHGRLCSCGACVCVCDWCWLCMACAAKSSVCAVLLICAVTAVHWYSHSCGPVINICVGVCAVVRGFISAFPPHRCSTATCSVRSSDCSLAMHAVVLSSTIS